MVSKKFIATPRKSRLTSIVKNIQLRQKTYLSRRPHRSFRRTYRRDYTRSLELPGYWAFTSRTITTLTSNWRLFLPLTLIYALLNAVFVGLSSQEAYSQLADFLQESSASVQGGVDTFTQAGLLLISGISGSFAPQLTDVQQVYSLVFGMLLWLSTVWLLRAILAGNTPRLRDAMYSAGAPIIPTGLVFLMLLVQLIPIALTALVMNAAISSELLANPFISMVAWVVAALIGVLTLYWMTSTFVALIVVTLPNMYPWQAVRTAGDLVVGRRIRILLRLVWLGVGIILLWFIVVLPTILLEKWLRSFIGWIENVPIVPVAVLVITSFATVFAATYIYLLYRKVVEDDAEPA